MEHQPAIYALKRLHAELGAQILDNKAEAERLRSDMMHVEAVMKMLDPTFNLRKIAPKRRNNRNPLFPKGEMVRAVFAVLRDAQGPMKVSEIVIELFRKHADRKPTIKELRDMAGGVNSSLRNYTGKGVERVGEGSPGRWRLRESA